MEPVGPGRQSELHLGVDNGIDNEGSTVGALSQDMRRPEGGTRVVGCYVQSPPPQSGFDGRAGLGNTRGVLHPCAPRNECRSGVRAALRITSSYFSPSKREVCQANRRAGIANTGGIRGYIGAVRSCRSRLAEGEYKARAGARPIAPRELSWSLGAGLIPPSQGFLLLCRRAFHTSGGEG